MVASRLLLLLQLPLLAGGVLSPARPSTLSRAASSWSPLPRKSATLPLRIDGRWYDVSEWADEHPGGAPASPSARAPREFFSHTFCRRANSLH